MRHGTAAIGAGLITINTLLISTGDAIVKHVATRYEAPQLFAISALVVVILSCASAGASQKGRNMLRSSAPWIMALRALLTVVATLAFFMAFRRLPLADMFLFVGLMPIFAAAFSGPILGEPVRAHAWLALALGLFGVVSLAPGGAVSLGTGHLWGLAASVTGTASMVLGRLLSRRGDHALAQVLYPHLAVAVVMALALPLVWRTMPLADLGWILFYALSLFAGRWLMVEAFARLQAYVATPLMNLQFVWMVAIGYAAFGEVPSQATLFGAALVILSGLWLVAAEYAAPRLARIAAS